MHLEINIPDILLILLDQVTCVYSSGLATTLFDAFLFKIIIDGLLTNGREISKAVNTDAPTHEVLPHAPTFLVFEKYCQ